MTTPADATPDPSLVRPSEPCHSATVWYRGWEISWNDLAAKWAWTGWDAYKGGCDLGAPRVQSAKWKDCLDEIDEYEDTHP